MTLNHRFSVTAGLTLALLMTSGLSCTTAHKKPDSALPGPAASATKPSELQNLGINLDLQKRTLSNGLTVLMVEDHTVPVISYQSWFKVGSVDERPGITGIAHLFEHLMFKGTPKYGAKEFFLQLEARGASVNAYTTRDYTVYHETFTPNLTDRVIDMESDRMAHLTLNEEAFKTERQVVFEERRLRTDNSPGGRVQEALWALAYHTHPYSWPVIGYPEDLGRMTVEDLKKFFATYYQPGNATIVIVGDFKTDLMFEKIKKAYGGIAGHKRSKRDIPEEKEQNEERRLVLYDQVATERLSLAYHASGAENDDSYALDVLANVLFAGTNSRGHQKLVEEMQIASDVSGVAYTPTYPGLFMMTATMKGKHVATEAEARLEALVRDIQLKGVTEEEIRFAVRQLTVQVVDSVRTAHGLGTLIGTVQMVFDDPQRFAEDLAKYLKVTSDDVKRVANQYLLPNHRSVVTLKPGSLPGVPAPAAKEGAE
ncbi:MAG: insulinase family protein [Methylotenera sp.]|nr:insulinase family protein [Oligoflexia bacterium]